jgi:hypothetical protein
MVSPGEVNHHHDDEIRFGFGNGGLASCRLLLFYATRVPV